MSASQKVKICFLFLGFSLKLIAMEQLTEGDCSELKNRIRQIEFAQEVGPSHFYGSSQTLGSFINDQILRIEEILNRYSINHPREKTWGWLSDLKNKVSPKESSKSSNRMQDDYSDKVCDISGLDKVEVLKALFYAATTNTYYPCKNELSEEDLADALDNLSDIDYLGGRPLKVSLDRDTFNTLLYNRDNGYNAAQDAIAELRRKLKK